MDVPELTRLAGPARLAFYTPVREIPSLADRKGSALLTANALVLSVIMFLMTPIRNIAASSVWWGAIILVFVLTLVALLLAGALSAYRGMVSPMPPMPRSLAFYGHLVGNSLDEYRQQMRSFDRAQAVRDILNYNYSVATQAAKKFRFVNRAVRLFEISLPLWMALLTLIAIKGGR